jgi:hypothetical protein
MTSHQKKVAAGTASSIFALLAAFLALFAVAFALLVSQPKFSVDVTTSHRI